MTEYDAGLVAWLRGLPARRPKNQIDRRDAVEARYSALAVTEGLAVLYELPNYMVDADRAYVLLVDLTPAGIAALAERP